PAHYRGVGKSRFDQPMSTRKYLGAGRARCGDRHRRAVEIQIPADEFGYRIHGLTGTIAISGGQRPAGRIPPPVGKLGLVDTGRAGADQNRNAVRAVTLARARHGPLEPALAQAELCKTDVAEIELRKPAGYRLALEAIHTPDPGIESGGFEIVGTQSGPTIAQGGKSRLAAQTQRICSGTTAEDEGIQSGRP